MIEIGFEESLIIDKINNSQNTFETSISSLKDLKSKGISLYQLCIDFLI